MCLVTPRNFFVPVRWSITSVTSDPAYPPPLPSPSPPLLPHPCLWGQPLLPLPSPSASSGVVVFRSGLQIDRETQSSVVKVGLKQTREERRAALSLNGDRIDAGKISRGYFMCFAKIEESTSPPPRCSKYKAVTVNTSSARRWCVNTLWEKQTAKSKPSIETHPFFYSFFLMFFFLPQKCIRTRLNFNGDVDINTRVHAYSIFFIRNRLMQSLTRYFSLST